ncbi:MAG: DUF3352 domain-containing protein, partial [Planctomycetota bacterium]
GLSKIRGVGGGLFRGGDLYDGISHLHVVIDPPRDGFFGVLRPEPVSLSPPSWVPTEISSYNAFGWDIETTFNNIGKIVSRFGGEGQFEKFIDRSFQRPFDWDIREVLISKVTGNYVSLHRNEEPAGWSSSARADGLEFEDSESIALILDTLKTKLHNKGCRWTTIAGQKVCQLPRPRKAKPGQRQVQPHLWQTGRWLIFSDSISFMEEIIRTNRGTGQRLLDDDDYALVVAEIDRQLDGDHPFLVSFRRDAEQLRFVYDTLKSKGMNREFWGGKNNKRLGNEMASLLSRQTLPNFDLLSRYFFVSGIYGADEPGGVHLGAITLRPF